MLLGRIEQQIEYDIKYRNVDAKTAYRNCMKSAHQGNIHYNMNKIREHMKLNDPHLLEWFDELNVLS